MKKKDVKNSKIIKIGILAAMVLSMVSSYQHPVKADLNSEQYEGVLLNKANFPDKDLRKILKPIDENKDGLISIMEQKNQEEGAVLKINVKKGTLDLTGISKLGEIKTITITGSNQKVEFKNMSELSDCKKIRELYVNYIKTDTFNIEGTKKLKTVTFFEDKIKNVTVSDNKNLKEFNSNVKIDNLKFGKNPKLTYVTVTGVKNLDVKKLTNVKYISVSGKRISRINVTKNKKLKDLRIQNTKISEVNLKKNNNIESLMIEKSPLKKIDLSKNKKLEYIGIHKTDIKKLDLKNQRKLTTLFCDGNKLNKLNLKNQTKLEWLECNDNQLTKIIFSKQNKLRILNCDNNMLENLDTAKLTELSDLEARFNDFTEINLSSCLKLRFAKIGNNELNQIDISKNIELEYLNIKDTNIKEVDVSNNKKLIVTNMDGNYAGYNVACRKDVVLKANGEVVKAYK